MTNLVTTAIHLGETAPLPDFITRMGVSFLCSGAKSQLARSPRSVEAEFARDMARQPIALHTDAANEQHYELPPEFFRLCLGPRLKYSSCLYPTPETSLEEAEEAALEETCRHADLSNGQEVLELGCGWGSLTLWMAERYPASRITAVSNSAPQRAHIEGVARARGLGNVRVITADMNDFTPAVTPHFDRVVSVEMFEHMSNWQSLLGRIRSWLKPDGRLFLHVFSHRQSPYRFDHTDPADWIAKYFFTGGVMPSHGLIRQFDTGFEVEADWRWSGTHYRRTATDWLANFDRNAHRIREIMADVYGPDAKLWTRRWRLFYLATEGLFGHSDGKEWGVSHYRLKAV